MRTMQTIALHTRIAEGREADYVREHRQIPDDLDPALRRAGVRSWRIWRDGRDLFHLLEVEDYRAMRRQLAEDPANQRSEEHTSELQSRGHLVCRLLLEKKKHNISRPT